MSTKKKKRRSVFVVLFVIVLLLLIAATVTANVIFSGDRVPKVAGYYLYLHEEADMEPDIPQNSLVIAKEAPQTSLSPGNKVLCYLADGNLALRVIYQMTLDADNQTLYYPGTQLEQSELTIPRSNIFAICNWASKELYQFVNFSTSVTGLMVCLVVPCIILIILLLVKIARSSKEELDEEDFLFDEEEFEAVSVKPAKKAPLFDPKQGPDTDMSLEKKKSSISENFSEKPVNENSPYQKSVQERTMKFKKIQQEDIEQAKQEEKKPEPKEPKGTQIFSPQEVEESAAKDASKPQQPRKVEPVVPPPQKSTVEPAHLATEKSEKSEDKPSKERSAAPNIDDVLNPSELRAAKSGQRINHKIAASGSIDDLIAALEKEKKKL